MSLLNLPEIEIEGLSTNEPKYFFLAREIGLRLEDAVRNKLRSHVKVARNKASGNLEFLDYCGTRKYYTTLDQWVAESGCQMSNVLYGRNNFDGRPTYITLADVLSRINKPEPETGLEALFARLTTNSVPAHKIFVEVTTMVPGNVYATHY